jgi:hypothetical protein
MISIPGAGRLLWLTPIEWSMLLVSAAFCGFVTLLLA